jgi:HAD superfamily hydrolase (TIGR01662 family)
MSRPPARPTGIAAVLFDRDGTLIHDRPYNGEPALVEPLPGAVAAVARVRQAGLRVGLISNQSGVARGLITAEQVEAVNARVAELFGAFDIVLYCPHGPLDGCACRKPEPGMVRWAAAGLGMATHRVVVVGDIGTDVEAAQRADATGILVPTDRTRPAEVAAAPVLARDLTEAVDLVLRLPSAVEVA